MIAGGPLYDKIMKLRPKNLDDNSYGEDYQQVSRIKEFAYEHFIDDIVFVASPTNKTTITKITESSTATTTNISTNTSIIYHITVNTMPVDPYYYMHFFDRQEFQSDREIYAISNNLLNMINYRNRDIDFYPKMLKYTGIFTNLRTGKLIDFTQYRGKLIVLTHYYLYSTMYYGDYSRIKDIFALLKNKYPGIITIFGIADGTDLNNKIVKCYDVLKETPILSDPEFPYPIADVTALQMRDNNFIIGFCRNDGIVYMIFKDFSGFIDPVNDRSIIGMIDKVLPSEKQAMVRLTLVEAARNNDLEEVRSLLREGADPLQKEDGHYAIDWAVYFENSDMAREIAGKRSTSDDIYTASFLAIANGRSKISEALISRIAFSGNNVSDIWKLKSLYAKAEESGDDAVLANFKKIIPSAILFLGSDFTFSNLIASGIKPGISPDFPFPVSPQPFDSTLCELYAMKHVLKYKYNDDINISSWEKLMGKLPHDIFTFPEIAELAYKVGLEYEYSTEDKADPGLFFYYLSRGEPVITEREYGRDKHRHSVVAYSFDAGGIWLSDSANGKRWRIPVDSLIRNPWFTMRILKKKASQR